MSIFICIHIIIYFKICFFMNIFYLDKLTHHFDKLLRERESKFQIIINKVKSDRLIDYYNRKFFWKRSIFYCFIKWIDKS